MKYVLAALAAVAAIAALILRPPGTADRPAAPPERSARSSERPAVPRAASAPQLARVVVYVAGEVHAPGVYALAPDRRVQDALARAGGAKTDADLVAVNLAAPLEDGAEIVVPGVGAARARNPRFLAVRPPKHRRARHGRTPRKTRGASTGRAAESLAAPLDLNTADAGALAALPGIGPGLAERIVAYRELNGPFGSVDELADVAGITPHLLDGLAPLLATSSH